MSRFFKIVVAFLCLIAMLTCAVACSNGEESSQSAEHDHDTYYTITFQSNGGTPIDSIKVKGGHHATEPTAPILENHIFCRWLLDGRPFFFDTKQIKEDITLEAQWIAADTLFGLSPVGEGFGITEIKQQLSLNKLVIPSVINGKTVVAILDNGCEMIHDGYADAIVFPETITSVGKKSFKGITATKLNFLGTINHIDESSFEGCETLTSLKLGTGLERIPFRAFVDCKALKTLDLPEGITVIEENAFEGCSSMLTIVMPSTLTTIENRAFESAALKTIFFKGTEAQFDAIEIADGNDKVLDAKVYYYSETEPTTQGDFWHYDKSNSPVTW